MRVESRTNDLRQRRTSPIGFVALVVTVFVLGWMYRFEQTESHLLSELHVDVDQPGQFVHPDKRQLERSPPSSDAISKQEETRPRVDTAKLRAEAEQAKAEAEQAKAEAEQAKANLAKLRKEVEQVTEALTQKQKIATETAAVKAVSAQKSVPDRKVYYIDSKQTAGKDAFSASWLQKTEDFLSMDLSKIGICEDAAFIAFERERAQKLRMTLDWLDFSLEHLSKWWKMLQIFNHKEVYNTAMQRFDQYLAKAPTFPVEPERSFRETISVIAFQAYKDGSHPEMAYNLTLKSLGATVESLRRAGFGRVVVVGNGEDDAKVTQATFHHLQGQMKPGVNQAAIISKVGDMEVGYADFNVTLAKSNNVRRNVPKAALEGLKVAFQFSQQDQRTEEERALMNIWLGKKMNWKYVYLTEPDSILQTRPSTLKQLKEEVDKGMVLVPHRLQPIPHETDARGLEKDHLFLPEAEFPVIDLDAISENDACCDAHKGPNYRPGPSNFPSCGNFWYMCDFNKRVKKEERTHDRIKQYSLIRLTQGTQIVSLAGLEWGRPCSPKKNHVCVLPDSSSDTQKKV